LGSNVQMLKVPEAGLDIMVMVNRTDAWSFSYVDQILDCCLPGLESPCESPRGPGLKGVFRSPKTGCVVHLYMEGAAQMAAVWGHPYPFEPDPHGVLRAAGYGASLKFSLQLVSDEVLEFHDYGNRDELVAVAPAGQRESSGLAGRYRSDSTGTELEIAGTRMCAVGRFGSATHHLECLAAGVWRSRAADELTMPAQGVLTLDVDGQGVRFSNAMNRNLNFRRVS